MIMAKDSHGNYVKIEDIKQQDSFKGISPINFKSNGDNLKNYRIYGNTISGESVGDRTKNLWDGIEPFSNTNTDTKMQLDIWFRFYPASASSSSVSAASAASNAQIGQHIIRTITPQEGYERLVVKHNGSSKDIIFISKILEVEKTYTVSFDITKNDVQTVSGVIISNIQIEENSQATDYEPYGYRVPMTVTNETDTETTNLYLPEQIKMVGDEAEYIDFKEQKQYRVRKNLLKNTATTRTYGRDDNNPEIYPGVTFTVNDNGSIICNGKTNVSYISVIIGNVNLSADSYIFSGNPNGVNSNNNTFKYQAYNNDLNLWFQDNENGINFELTEQTNISVRIVIYQDYDCNNLTFYPMIRKADIEDDTYEPYIENTELDVTIPALPTLSGTNTLSVNTNIKPSKVWGGLNDPRDILYVKDKLGNILFSKYYEIEDEPPLTYKAKKTGTLKNYRIYGNTVDGESVGDRTGNLFDGSWENKFIDTYGNTGYSTDRVLSSYVTVIPNQTYSVKSNMHIRSVHSYNGTTHTQALIDNVAGLDGATFTIPADSNSIRISLKKANDGTITPDDVEWCMLNIGSTALPYEPYGKYKIPVTLTADSAETTDIYLDEPLCKIGTYTDYADYENQKVIRKVARKVFDGAEQFNYNANNNTIDYIVPTIIVGSAATINCSSNHITSLSGDMNWQSRNIPDARYISASYSGGSSKIRFIWNDNNGVMDLSNLTAQLSTWYANGNPLVVDYIVETPVEEQITLPAISTLAGINTLTVGTEAQPSDIYLKGKIEKKPKIYYYSQDGQTLLYTESVLKGGNGTYSTTPTKPSTAQYTYTFVGWTAQPNQTAATANILTNVQTNINVYAAFSETARTYTVYFYNGQTLLQTVNNVLYNGTATYTGATPTSSQAGYIFSGWSPSNTNITADTSCYAQFEEDDMYESITDTWSEIIANVSNGTYSTKYHIGDTKKIDLGTEGEVIMTIVGIDTDDLADNSGKAPITWISKQLLKTDHRMNPPRQDGISGTGSLGGWEETEMRSYLKETVKPLIPEAVRNAIKPVKKYTRIYNVSSSAVNNVLTTEDVWIPSYKEVFGLDLETLGPTYSTTFPDNASRIKSKAGNSAALWWLRSAGTNRYFYYVNADGSSNITNAKVTGGVALGFCT